MDDHGADIASRCCPRYQFTLGMRRVAQYQSPSRVCCSCSAAGPSIRTWVSRQGVNSGQAEILIADIVPADPGVVPSTTTILR